jgi:hypothetical protein
MDDIASRLGAVTRLRNGIGGGTTAVSSFDDFSGAVALRAAIR